MQMPSELGGGAGDLGGANSPAEYRGVPKVIRPGGGSLDAPKYSDLIRRRRTVADLVGETRPEFKRPIESPSDLPAESVRISARNVRGLQVGHHNMQVNSFEYEVEKIDLNLESFLSRAGVREALANFARQPERQDLRREADRVLGQKPFWRAATELKVEPAVLAESTSERMIDALLFVENSSGVQVGNHSTQDNKFLYVVASSVDAAQLLADDSELRASVLDCVCGEGSVGLRHELTEALESAILESPDIRIRGEFIRLPKAGQVQIDGSDGVSVGNSNRQHNSVTARIVVPGALVGSVESFQVESEDSENAEHLSSPVADVLNGPMADGALDRFDEAPQMAGQGVYSEQSGAAATRVSEVDLTSGLDGHERGVIGTSMAPSVPQVASELATGTQVTSEGVTCGDRREEFPATIDGAELVTANSVNKESREASGADILGDLGQEAAVGRAGDMQIGSSGRVDPKLANDQADSVGPPFSTIDSNSAAFAGFERTDRYEEARQAVLSSIARAAAGMGSDTEGILRLANALKLLEG